MNVHFSPICSHLQVSYICPIDSESSQRFSIPLTLIKFTNYYIYIITIILSIISVIPNFYWTKVPILQLSTQGVAFSQICKNLFFNILKICVHYLGGRAGVVVLEEKIASISSGFFCFVFWGNIYWIFIPILLRFFFFQRIWMGVNYTKIFTIHGPSWFLSPANSRVWLYFISAA